MKRINLLLLACLLAGTMFAQAGDQGLCLHFGFASPTIRLNSPAEQVEDKTKLTTTTLNGTKIGLAYEASYWKGFGNMIGINYTYGVDFGKWGPLGGESQMFEFPRMKSRVELHALEIFVDWQYKFEIAKNTYLIVYTGPTIQCNVAMTETDYVQNAIDQDPDKKTPISSFNYDDAEMAKDFKRINVTWGVGAGFQYDRYFIRGGYDFGLINPYKQDNFSQMGYGIDRNTRGRFDQWQIKLGVFLWQNK